MDIFNPAFWIFVAVIAGIYAIMALGLYVQFSLAGLPNFGHVAFMAVAAYTMAILVVRFECRCRSRRWPALLAAVVLGLVLGVPALRLRADYLAIATVAGGEIIRYLAMNLPGAHRRPDRLDRHARAGRDRHVQRAAGMRMLDRVRERRRPCWAAPSSRDVVMAILVWGLARAPARRLLAARAVALGAGAAGDPRGRDRGDRGRQERLRASSCRR